VRGGTSGFLFVGEIRRARAKKRVAEEGVVEMGSRQQSGWASVWSRTCGVCVVVVVHGGWSVSKKKTLCLAGTDFPV